MLSQLVEEEEKETEFTNITLANFKSDMKQVLKEVKRDTMIVNKSFPTQHEDKVEHI